MSRIELNDETLGNVVGGNIVFTSDHTTCGLNCNNQCRVNDYEGCLDFISQNMFTMTEKDMMRAMLANGLITRL